MTNRQEAEDFLIGLGYFKGSPAATELSEILTRHAAEQRKDCARIALDVAKVYSSRTDRIAPHIDALAQLIATTCLNAIGKSDG